MNFISQVISNHVSNVPTQAVGIAGFTAFVWTDKTTSRSATVTDIPLETGVVISDHINIDPVQISIGGVVSDTHIRLTPESLLTEQLDRNIGVIDSYLGNRLQPVRQKIGVLRAKAQQLLDIRDSVQDKAQGLFDAVTGQKKAAGGITQQFIDTFTGIFENRELISVDMGYQVLDNLALESFSTSQSNEDDFVFFTMTLKQVRFVTFEQVQVKASKAGIAAKSSSGMSKTGAAQMSKAKNKGSQTPVRRGIFTSIVTGKGI